MDRLETGTEVPTVGVRGAVRPSRRPAGHTSPGSAMRRLHPVRPAPHVRAHLYMEYVRNGKPAGLTFRQYLHAIGFTDPAAHTDGMDDGSVARPDPAGGPALVSVPTRPVTGRLRIIVL